MLVLISEANSMKRALYLNSFIFHERYNGSIGMQCPPRPGPGVNFIKPKGLVPAASITSHTSTPRRSHMMASSLTSPILIMRKVFSSSLDISAASTEDTITTVWIAPEYQAVATSEQALVMPPITLGVLSVVQSSRPGSTRSGEKQMKRSSPTFSPDLSVSMGSVSSRVVPG